MKHTLVKGGAAALRAWYRHIPCKIGKRLVWRHVVARLLRSGMETEAPTVLGATIRVRFPDTVQSYVYFFGVWEPAITAYLTASLAPGDIVIDIGANVGYDSLLAAHCVGSSGRVYAIEASPTVFRLLQDNLALNNATCVIAINAAVCASAGPITVFLHNSSNLGGTTIVPSVAQRRDAAQEATVCGNLLTALVPEAEICRARLIKIDVEGAEWPVVQGFAALLPRLSDRTELLIEVSAQALHDHGASVEEFLALFRAAGFQPFVIENRYSVDMYLEPVDARLKPLTESDFEQLDLLFRRV